LAGNDHSGSSSDDSEAAPLLQGKSYCYDSPCKNSQAVNKCGWPLKACMGEKSVKMATNILRF